MTECLDLSSPGEPRPGQNSYSCLKALAHFSHWSQGLPRHSALPSHRQALGLVWPPPPQYRPGLNQEEAAFEEHL